jgi:hypothetical protein
LTLQLHRPIMPNVVAKATISAAIIGGRAMT